MIVAIDGPAGSGKSSVSKKVASMLNFLYIDTGAMYRALTFYAIKNNIDINNEKALELAAKEIKIDFLPLSPSLDGRGVGEGEQYTQKVLLNEMDVTIDIRTPLVNQYVSPVSAYPSVREIMVKHQRELAQTHKNVILEGRDIGTVVFPYAEKKFFLIASLEERAKRRLKEQLERGFNLNLEDVKKELASRDEYDSTRKVAPLKPAADAIIIDTTDLTFDQVVKKIVSLCEA